MVDRDGTVALADYRGRTLLLGLFRGIYCPFCRRAIVRMGQAWDRFKAEGVEALAMVATTPDNARLLPLPRPVRHRIRKYLRHAARRLTGHVSGHVEPGEVQSLPVTR